MISGLAMDHNIAANIHFASTRSIEGKAYGNMLLGIADDRATIETALEYFNNIPNIIVEEINSK
jgi:D-methionine transport system ATP-binding protein